MRDIPIAELYNKDGKMKLWHRISPAVKILSLCFIFAIVTFYLSAILNLTPLESCSAFVAVVVLTMLFGLGHVKLSQEMTENQLRGSERHEVGNRVRKRKRKKNGSWDDKHWD